MRPVSAPGNRARAARHRTRMSILTLVGTILVVGFVLWAINAFFPMEGRVKTILNAVVGLLLVLWLLSAFGVLPQLGRMRVG
jgi:hypothetical protein